MRKSHKLTMLTMTLIVLLLSVSCLTTAPKGSNVPDFVLNPPIATDAIYGVGYGKKSSPALSMKVAETNARADIANQIETSIQSAMTEYIQEAGVEESSQTIEFTESITRQITDTTLNGAKPKQRVPQDDGGYWVLMVYSQEELVEAFEDTVEEFVRNEAAAFAEFKADEAVKALSAELENNPTKSEPVE